MINKWFSRKLAAWLASGILLVFNFITEDTWLIITLAYIGLQAGQDLYDKYVNKASNNDR